jgi:dynein heavy chain
MEKYRKLKEQLDQYITNSCINNWKDEIKDFLGDNGNSSIEQKLDVSVLTWSQNKVEELPSQIMANPLFQKSKKSGLLESNFDSNLHKVLIEVTYWQKLSALGYVTIPHQVAKLLTRKEQLRITRESIMLIVRDYNNIKFTINEKEQALFSDHLMYLEKTIEPGIRRHNWGSQVDNFVYNCRRECLDVYSQVK